MTKEKTTDKNDKVNIYKIATIILGLILLALGILFVLNYTYNSGLKNGYQISQFDTTNQITSMLNEKGYLELHQNNYSVQLVPASMITETKENTLKQIISEVEANGMVRLYNSTDEIILIKHEVQE